MNLKKVKLVVEYVIVANDTEEDSVARAYAHEAVRDIYRRDLNITISTYTSGCVENWTSDCIPYNSNGYKTTEEYLNLMTK